MRTNRIYGLCALQLIGLGVQVINRRRLHHDCRLCEQRAKHKGL